MNIRRQDISGLILYFLGYSRIRNLLFRFQRRPVTRIVTFHDILPNNLRHFKANLHFLKQNSNVVSFDDFFSGNLCSKKINIVITFDDGYKSWMTYAIPLLKKLGLPATFFVASGFIGLSEKAESEYMRSNLSLTLGAEGRAGGLSPEDIRTIIKEGFFVGGHTVNHTNLSKLRNRAKVIYELAEDKHNLEKLAGTTIKYFAYPSGEYINDDIDLAELLKELGYSGAVTTVPGFNYDHSLPYRLFRELTRASMSRAVFKARIFGNYDPIHVLKKRISKTL